MPQTLTPPFSYLITSGATDETTTPASAEFARLVALVAAATRASVTFIQLREKLLRPRVLYELTAHCAALTRDTTTRLLVNDRADIARAADADGVQLTAQSLPAHVVRRAFGADFLIGVSTHSLAEARAARDDGADFAVFGPLFDTPSNRAYGPPAGLATLRTITSTLTPFPIIAIGGITRANMTDALAAGAQGIAAIRLFAAPQTIAVHVRALQDAHAKL